MSKGIESEIPQFKTIPAVTFEKCIKFRMNFTKQIAMLDGKRMRLEAIDSNGKNLILVHNDTAMFLATRNLKTFTVGKQNQFLVFGGFQDHLSLFPDQLGHTYLDGS